MHGQGSKKPPDEGGSDDTQKQYFKERLIRKTSMPTETKEPLKNGMTHLDYEGGSHLLPNFMLTPIAFEQLCLPWKQCLRMFSCIRMEPYGLMRMSIYL